MLFLYMSEQGLRFYDVIFSIINGRMGSLDSVLINSRTLSILGIASSKSFVKYIPRENYNN